MDSNVKQEYDALLTEIALKQGALMSPPNLRQYGWIDGDYAHLSSCGVRTWGAVRETEFQQFEGTFFEGERIRHAVDVSGVTCNCGFLTDREVRWEPTGGLSEVAEAVFTALYEKMRGE